MDILQNSYSCQEQAHLYWLRGCWRVSRGRCSGSWAHPVVLQRGLGPSSSCHLGASATCPFSSRGICSAILSAVPSQWWLLPARPASLCPCLPALWFHWLWLSEEGPWGNMASGMWWEDSHRRNCGGAGGVPLAAQCFICFTSLSIPRKSYLRKSARMAAMLRFLFRSTMPRAP